MTATFDFNHPIMKEIESVADFYGLDIVSGIIERAKTAAKPVAGKQCEHGQFWYAEVESENPDFPVSSLSIDCRNCSAAVPLEMRVAKSEPDDDRFVSMLVSAKIKHKLVPIDEGTRIDIPYPGGKVWAMFYANGKFASIGFFED